MSWKAVLIETAGGKIVELTTGEIPIDERTDYVVEMAKMPELRSRLEGRESQLPLTNKEVAKLIKEGILLPVK